jgi:hypothetical protein
MQIPYRIKELLGGLLLFVEFAIAFVVLHNELLGVAVVVHYFTYLVLESEEAKKFIIRDFGDALGQAILLFAILFLNLCLTIIGAGQAIIIDEGMLFIRISIASIVLIQFLYLCGKIWRFRKAQSPPDNGLTPSHP